MKNPGIYVFTNNVNGKAYVGLDSNLPRRVDLHLRGKSRCPAIRAAIKRYGTDNFTVEIIRYPNVSRQILCWFERSHIAERNTKAPNGYNLTDGGDGIRNPSAETRAKMSANQRGKTVSADTRAKMSANHRGMRGKTHSAETRAKISDALRGENNPNFNFGRKHTVETKAKISKARRGKKHTAETRAKISNSHRSWRLEKRGQGTLF